MKIILLILLIAVTATSVWLNLPLKNEGPVVLNDIQEMQTSKSKNEELLTSISMLSVMSSSAQSTEPLSGAILVQDPSHDSPEKGVEAQLIEQLQSMDLNAMYKFLETQPLALYEYEQLIFSRLITLIFAVDAEPPFFKEPLKHADKMAFYQNLTSINEFKVLAAQGDVFAALPLALFYSVSKNTAPAEHALRQIYVNVDRSSQLGMLEGIGSLYMKSDPLTAHGYYLLRYQGNYGSAENYYKQNANLINATFTLEELQAKSQALASDLKEQELLHAVGNKISLKDYF